MEYIFRKSIDRINGHNVTYLRNGNCIVAKLDDDCSYDVLNTMYDKYQMSYYALRESPRANRWIMPYHPSAVAKCLESDTFDIDYGCDLAYRRLEKKYYNMFVKRMISMYDYYAKVLFRCADDTKHLVEKYIMPRAERRFP